jgi:tetratricopeptide (TPR) repeat protein
LSKRFAEQAASPFALRSLAAGALALMLAACGSSTPKQAEVEKPRETAVPVATRVDADGDVRGRARQARAGMPEVEQRTEQLPGAIAEPTPAATAPAPEGRRERRSERRTAEEANAAAAAVEPVPEAAAAAYTRAVAAMRAENWLEAELELETLVLEHPGYPGPHVNLALVYLHDGRRDDARKELELALEIEPGHVTANTQLGILLREEGKFAAAEETYRRALETDPDHSLAHYNLGVLLDIYLRRPAEALEHYEAYQASLAQPNETVARWIVDLKRRAGNGGGARVAQGEGL